MEEIIEFLDKYNRNLYKVEDGKIIADTIDLSANNIDELPKGFGSNIECNYLYLSNNNLSTLPESFSDLKVNVLSLSGNKFKELPEWFGKMNKSGIRSLTLDKNLLTDGLRYFKDWDDETLLWLYGLPFSKAVIGDFRTYTVKDYRKEIDFEWELWNNKDLEGAKDCYDSGLFSFNIK